MGLFGRRTSSTNPVPASTREQDPYYLTSSGCPYAEHFRTEPEGLGAWEQASNDKLEKGWKASGSPGGPDVNDHNWVKLGQGNTLGLVAGSLSIGQETGHDLSVLSEAARVGLFAESGLYPAIVRFSDFGADTGGKLGRLGRMAVKIAYPDAWCGEINFTTAETFEQFSLGSFEEVAHFVGDPGYAGVLAGLRFRVRKLLIALREAWVLRKEWASGELLSKTYYSQLAYLLGPGHAFKYRFRPLQDPLGEVQDTEDTARVAIAEWLERGEAKFELQLQVLPDPGSELVQRRARDRWEARWVPVGLLTLAQQSSEADGMGSVLKVALAEELGLDRERTEWLHKSLMFHPLLTAAEHMPVGETQQFRAHFYPVAARHRLGLFSNRTIDPVTPPFDALMARRELADLFGESESSSPEVAARYFDQMDRYTQALCKLIPPKVIEANRSALTDGRLEDSEIDLYGPQRSNRVDVGKLSITLIDEDDTFGELGFKPWLLLRALRTELLFPMEDVFVDCTVEDLAALKARLGLAQSLPRPTHHWDEMSSDEAMSRIYFYGTGAVTLEEVDDGRTRFVADTGWLKDLEVRPGFRPYGARVAFDADQRLLSIHDYAENETLTPGDAGWAHAKHLAKQSLAMSVTGVHHLLWSHFGVANTMVNAAITHLPLEHPIRRLLGPFTFRTVLVNNRAKDSLLPEHSMFHHATALTYPAVVDLLQVGQARCDFWQPFPETARNMGSGLNALAGQGRLPFLEDGVAYFGVIRRFVSAWIDNFYPDDTSVSTDADLQAFGATLTAGSSGMKYVVPALETKDRLADTLTQFVFVATGLHEVVGAVVEYTDLEYCGFRARPGATRNDLQSWLIVACLMSTTSIRTPALLGSSFPNYFEYGFEADSWSRFQHDLKKEAAANDLRNESRRYPFLGFNPKILESSISV